MFAWLFPVGVSVFLLWLILYLLVFALFTNATSGDHLTTTDKNHLAIRFSGQPILGKPPKITADGTLVNKEGGGGELALYWLLAILSLSGYTFYYSRRKARIEKDLARSLEGDGLSTPLSSGRAKTEPLVKPGLPPKVATRAEGTPTNDKKIQKSKEEPLKKDIQPNWDKQKKDGKPQPAPSPGESQKKLRNAPGAYPGEEVLSKVVKGNCPAIQVRDEYLESYQESSMVSTMDSNVSQNVEVDVEAEAWAVPIGEAQRGDFFDRQRQAKQQDANVKK